MTTQLLEGIQNENGGGLSVSVSGKWTSVRHELARLEGKITAGEANKYMKKAGIETTAKQIVEYYKVLNGREPEWHHAGFYKDKNKKSTMGRTFFFESEEVEELIENWQNIEIMKSQRQAEKEAETQRQIATQIKGFFYEWTSDYSGRYGKKRNYKVLRVYEGSEYCKPNNFTALNTEAGFENAKANIGKAYYGWDEPQRGEFESLLNKD